MKSRLTKLTLDRMSERDGPSALSGPAGVALLSSHSPQLPPAPVEEMRFEVASNQSADIIFAAGSEHHDVHEIELPATSYHGLIFQPHESRSQSAIEDVPVSCFDSPSVTVVNPPVMGQRVPSAGVEQPESNSTFFMTQPVVAVEPSHDHEVSQTVSLDVTVEPERGTEPSPHAIQTTVIDDLPTIQSSQQPDLEVTSSVDEPLLVHSGDEETIVPEVPSEAVEPIPSDLTDRSTDFFEPVMDGDSSQSGVPPFNAFPNIGSNADSHSDGLTQSDVGVFRNPQVAVNIVTPSGNENPAYKISRPTATTETLTVQGTLSSHGPEGTITQPYSVTIPAGMQSVMVPVPNTMTNGQQIVTMQLTQIGDQSVTRPTATLFLEGGSQQATDAALYSAYRVGQSNEAFNVLAARHQQMILRTCHRVLGNWSDAEDVSQFVFLVLAQWQLRYPTTISGWLNKVARNASIALLRSKTRRSFHEREAAKPDMSQTEELSLLLADELQHAMNRLPKPLKEAVQLRYVEGHSQIEAAQVVGCPRGTLSQRAAHGLSRLREMLSSEANAG